MEKIGLIHGEGGRETQHLIREFFYKEFHNEELIKDKDAAEIELTANKIAFTTDSFVVKPIFFNGGDIGKLCVSGTVNDLVTSFSTPKYLSLSMVIEEGFLLSDLKKIVQSIKKTAILAGVKIVTGDTKVIERGKVDGIIINTSGIGLREKSLEDNISIGDKIIITSTIAEHGTAIAKDRFNLKILGDIKSDVNPLNDLIHILDEFTDKIRLLKDPTRGGIGQSFNEISKKYNIGINIYEAQIPIREEVRVLNEIIGLNPYYLASEGAMILIVDNSISDKIIEKLRKHDKYKNSAVIGEVIVNNKVLLIGRYNRSKVLSELDSIMLPRIC